MESFVREGCSIKLKRLIHYWVRGLFEILLAMPILLVVHVYFSSGLPLLLWVFALSNIYLASAIVRRVWRQAHKWQLYCVGIGGAFVISFAEAGFGVVGFFQAGVIFATIQRAFLYAKHAFSSSPQQNLYVFPMTAYFLASLLFPLNNSLSSYISWINLLGICSLILVVLKSNRETLEKETQQTASRTLTSITLLKNRLLTLIFLFVIFAFAITPLPYNSGNTQVQISNLVWSGLHMLNPAPEPFVMEPPIAQRSTKVTSLEDLFPAQETSLWAQISNYLLMIAFIVVVLGILIWFILWSIGHRGQLWVRFSAWIGHYLGRDAITTAGYIDEQSKIINWKEWSKERLIHVNGWRTRSERDPFWGELTDNNQRVRRAYSRWVGRLFHAPLPSKTPREIVGGVAEERPLSEEEQKLLEFYEAARYGGRKLSDQETEILRGIYERK